jgi:GTP-binding protein Era
VDKVIGRWQAALPSAEIIPISALDRQNLTNLLDRVKHYLPVGPPLYPNDTLTDRPQRFFASEIIRLAL